jgi:hypothetical protein
MKKIAALVIAASAVLTTVAVAAPASATSTCIPVRPGGSC